MRTPQPHEGSLTPQGEPSSPETALDARGSAPGERGRVISLRPPAGQPLDGPEGDRAVTTILLTDIVNSTARAIELGDHRWLELRERHDELVRAHTVRFGGRVLQSTGDGFVAVFDVPVQALRAAVAVQRGVRDLGLEVRAGIHTGECELRRGEPAGIAFHIGARVAAKAARGEVLVSRTVRDLVLGSELTLVERGAHALKGLPGKWRLYAVQA